MNDWQRRRIYQKCGEAAKNAAVEAINNMSDEWNEALLPEDTLKITLIITLQPDKTNTPRSVRVSFADVPVFEG